MKLIVTGCAGFIGSHLSEYLLKLNHYLIGIDSLNSYYSEQIKSFNLKRLKKYPNFQFYQYDLSKINLQDILGDSINFDGIFHIAGFAGVRYSIENPFAYIDGNITATIRIFEWIKKNTNIKMVIASSSSIYGEQEDGPFKEGSHSEDFPISQYAATKRSNELFGFTYFKLYKINVTFLRFFTVYGPNGRIDMAPLKFLVQIMNDIPIELYGDGKAIRDFTYIDDIIDGMYHAYETTNGYDILNLGYGKPHSVLDLIENLKQVSQKKVIVNYQNKKPGDVNLTYASIDKARKKFNFTPQTSLSEGIKKLYQWYEQSDDNLKDLYLKELNKR